MKRLDVLAEQGHDIQITRLVIQKAWSVDIVFAGTHEERAAVWGTGEHERLEAAVANAIAELDSNRERYLDKKRRDAFLPIKAAMGVKPRLKLT